MTIDEKERAMFEQAMETNVAKLSDFAKPYVGRLSNADRGFLLGKALEQMWETRKSYKPGVESLLEFWDRCLKAAANVRRTWRVSRFDGWTTVRGDRLGAYNPLGFAGA